MNFYGLKTCNTCRKAQKELRAAGIDFDVIDMRTDGVSTGILRTWSEQIEWEKLLNTRSTTWRNLSDEEKADINLEKAITLMAKYSTLIKRPVIEKDGKISVGWPSPLVSRE